MSRLLAIGLGGEQWHVLTVILNDVNRQIFYAQLVEEEPTPSVLALYSAGHFLAGAERRRDRESVAIDANRRMPFERSATR